MASLDSRRFGLKFPNGNVVYYEVDADGAVYWLRPRKGNKLQRYRVKDPKLAEWVRGQAPKQDEEQDEDS